jgi:hypothetical protein
MRGSALRFLSKSSGYPRPRWRDVGGRGRPRRFRSGPSSLPKQGAATRGRYALGRKVVGTYTIIIERKAGGCTFF